MSVIQPVKMVEICFMNERVSPTGQDEKKKLTPLAAQLVKKIAAARKITHMEYMRPPSRRKVPALIAANLTVFAFTRTSIYRTILGNTPRGSVFSLSCWCSMPMTPTHDTP